MGVCSNHHHRNFHMANILKNFLCLFYFHSSIEELQKDIFKFYLYFDLISHFYFQFTVFIIFYLLRLSFD
jgi:hypothetical protein